MAQSAAAAFNPAHKLIDQTVETAVRHGIMDRDKAEADAIDLYRRLQLPNPDTSATAIRTRCRAASCSAP